MRFFLLIVASLLLALPVFPDGFSEWKTDGLEISLDGTDFIKDGATPFLIGEKTDATAKALLLTIQKFPDEDTPRLAYADYLDENGEPEAAEFIRLQIATAKVPRGKDHRKNMNRTLQLLQKNQDRWFSAIAFKMQGLRKDWLRGPRILENDTVRVELTLRRGFIWGVGVKQNQFFDAHDSREWKHFETIYRRVLDEIVMKLEPAPIGFKIFGESDSNVAAVYAFILEHPALKRATAVGFHATSEVEVDLLNHPQFRALVDKNIRDLYLDTLEYIGTGVAEAGRLLRIHPEYQKLIHLTIGGLVVDNDGGAPQGNVFLQEVGQRRWPHLQELAVRGMGLNFVGAEAIEAGAAHFPVLRALDLASNDLADDALRALARVKLSELRSLDVSGNSFGSKGLNALAASRLAGQLHYLDAHRSSSRGYQRPLDPGEQPSRQGKACKALVEKIATTYL